jgi:replication factor A1
LGAKQGQDPTPSAGYGTRHPDLGKGHVAQSRTRYVARLDERDPLLSPLVPAFASHHDLLHSYSTNIITIMAPELTTGVLDRVLESEPDTALFESQPILQFLSIKIVDPKHVGTPGERYRVIVSDGHHYLQSMLATQLNNYVHDKSIGKCSIVRLTRFTVSTVREKRCAFVALTSTHHRLKKRKYSLLIVLAIDILEKEGEKIGEPQPLDAPPSAPAAVSTPSEDVKPNITPVSAAPPPQQAKPQTSTLPQTSTKPQTLMKPQTSTKSRTSYPIESLSPYQNNWTIKARVTQKSEIKRWSNQKGEGQLFSVTFMDESGEIRATGFNTVVDELYPKLEEGKVYYISKGRINLAKKKFTTVQNDYELSLEKNTEVEEVRAIMYACVHGH